MKDNANVTKVLAVTVRLQGPTAEAVLNAAEKFNKSPEEYCTEYIKWLGLMDVEGAA